MLFKHIVLNDKYISLMEDKIMTNGKQWYVHKEQKSMGDEEMLSKLGISILDDHIYQITDIVSNFDPMTHTITFGNPEFDEVNKTVQVFPKLEEIPEEVKIKNLAIYKETKYTDLLKKMNNPSDSFVFTLPRELIDNIEGDTYKSLLDLEGVFLRNGIMDVFRLYREGNDAELVRYLCCIEITIPIYNLNKNTVHMYKFDSRDLYILIKLYVSHLNKIQYSTEEEWAKVDTVDYREAMEILKSGMVGD